METIGKRYQLQHKLGQGGMGVVYCAIDKLNGEQVALKRVTLLLQEQAQNFALTSSHDYDLRLALAREFQTLASLRHPYIISVLDYGFDDQRQPYFTMSYLPWAQPITKAVQERPLAVRFKYLQELLEALIYLHRRGILHRDLKPDNVLVVDDVVQVLDFGLAAAKNQATISTGTLTYAAPEVIDQQPATELSDLYAVGVIAYELFAGNHPFEAKNVGALIKRIMTHTPDLTPLGLEPAVAAVIGRLLAKEPNGRYPSAQEALFALSAALGQTIPPESQVVRESFLQAANFVGRERERQSLLEAWHNAKSGAGSAWLIGGESGVGKSRLLNEIRIQGLVSGDLVLQGQGLANGGGLPYQLWRNAIRRLVVSVQPSDLAAGVLRPLVPDIESLLGRPVPAVPELEGKASQQRLWGTIVDLFRQAGQTIIVLLEDIHWATESLTVLREINRQLGELPVLVIASYRSDERPLLPQELPHMHLLPLERLNRGEIAQLSEAMLGEIGTQPALLELLQRETEGNAFFLVEVVRALAEEAGRLSAVGQMTLPESLFPQGVRTIVLRRLARIPAQARRLLDLVAIAGRLLDTALVQTLAQSLGLDMAAWLQLCAEAAVLDVVGVQWQFAHEKLREGVLADMEAGQRPLLHATVAQALEQLYHDDANQAATLAYHWQEAQNHERERHYAQIAGLLALRQYAHDEAIAFLSRAIELTPEEDVNGRYALLLAREEASDVQGYREAQKRDLESLTELAQRLDDPAKQALVALRRANYAYNVSDYPTVVAASQEAIRLTPNALLSAEGYFRWGLALEGLANVDEGKAHLEQALQMARQEGAEWLEAQCLCFLGFACYRQGEYAQEKALLLEALAIQQRIGDKRGEGMTLDGLGVVAHILDEYESAQAYYERSWQILEQVGDRSNETWVLKHLGWLFHCLAEYDLARDYYEQTRRMAQEINYRLMEADVIVCVGQVAYDEGQYAEARSLYETALAMYDDMGHRHNAGRTLNYLGHVACDMGDWEAARRFYTQSEQEHGEVQRRGKIEAVAGLAWVDWAQGDEAMAHSRVAEVMAYLAKYGILGIERPFRLYWSCYQALAARNDPRANDTLQAAHTLLQERAAQIPRPDKRKGFLENSSLHQDIIKKIKG